jgi:hypothetical protein
MWKTFKGSLFMERMSLAETISEYFFWIYQHFVQKFAIWGMEKRFAI